MTGQLAAGGRATAGYVGIPYEGELIEVDGFPVVTANFKSNANARYSADQSLTWFALQTPDGVMPPTSGTYTIEDETVTLMINGDIDVYRIVDGNLTAAGFGEEIVFVKQ